MKIKLNDIELVRGGKFRERAKGLKVKGVKSVQVNTPLRSSTAQVFDRGNLKMQLQFESTRRHETQEESSAYVLGHARKVSEVRGELLIDFEDSVNTVFCLKNAVVRGIESSMDGVTSVHKYDIVGEQFKIVERPKSDGSKA